jgi:hypothetical protein
MLSNLRFNPKILNLLMQAAYQKKGDSLNLPPF